MVQICALSMADSFFRMFRGSGAQCPTLRRISKLLVVVWMGACAPLGAQVDWTWGLAPEVMWWVNAAVEGGQLSEQSGQCVLDHLQTHGGPWAVEEAHAIACLTSEERQWMVESPAWKSWVEENRLEIVRPAQPMRMSWRHEHGWGDGPGGTSVWRWRLSSAKVRLWWEDSLRVVGSWTRSIHGRTWVVGEHRVEWGHGLAIPRSRPFADVAFMGGTQALIQSPPQGMDIRVPGGTLGGFAFHQAWRRHQVGVSASGRHVSGWGQKPLGRGYVGLSFHVAQDAWGMESHGSAVKGAKDWDWALAACQAEDQTTLKGRFSGRWVRGTTDRWQALLRTEWPIKSSKPTLDMRMQWSHGPARGPRVMGQLRIQSQDTSWVGRSEWAGELRWQLDASRIQGWRWQGAMSMDEMLCNLRWSRSSWTIWLGGASRGASEEATWNDSGNGLRSWGLDRAIRWTSPNKHVGPRRGMSTWGWMAMDGLGARVGTRVPVPKLEGLTWVGTPEQGQRLAVWGGHRWSSRAGEMRLTAQLFWSPSQQHTFRCALQCTWEP
ncbi:MAG: hypothetical protein O2791_06625 [Bacteroidetes bacterium]|nr:hypothetical protein [Bacteroidota bacterium]